MGSAALRVLGYQAALAANGIPLDPALIIEGGLWHRATGAEGTHRLLDSGVAVDAIFGLNDALALGALHALHARGIDVPGQVAVIGFDDIEDAAYTSPTLSSISPGREQIATTAVDLLLARIAGSTEPYRRVIPDFALIARESTGG
jgi:DNA-binding LacI/PurR family transcriptional regulator